MSLSYNMIFLLIIILLLLIISGLASSSETALFSLTVSDKKKLSKKKSFSAHTVLHLISIPDKILATILILNNFVNIGIVILSTYVANEFFDLTHSPALAFIIQVIAVTIIIVVFGEIIPKLYANTYPLKVAMFVALPLYLLTIIFSPFNYFMLRLVKLLSKNRTNNSDNISMNELSDALEITKGQNSDEEEILESIVKFPLKEVKEIMKSRLDVYAVDTNLKFFELAEAVKESGFSRIPVFDKSFDSVKGVLYVKDLLPHFHKNDMFRWQSLIRPPYFVPETKKINDLLKEFQNKKIHMAIVVDEFGGTSGIVTLEDILEEIVGEITDESDEDESIFKKIDDNNFIFNGRIMLNDFYKIIEVNDNIFDEVRRDADTLAGLILELCGEIPPAGKSITYKQFEFIIRTVSNRRINEIMVVIKRIYE